MKRMVNLIRETTRPPPGHRDLPGLSRALGRIRTCDARFRNRIRGVPAGALPSCLACSAPVLVSLSDAESRPDLWLGWATRRTRDTSARSCRREQIALRVNVEPRRPVDPIERSRTLASRVMDRVTRPRHMARPWHRGTARRRQYDRREQPSPPRSQQPTWAPIMIRKAACRWSSPPTKAAGPRRRTMGPTARRVPTGPCGRRCRCRRHR
jgi:hypothetical protein